MKMTFILSAQKNITKKDFVDFANILEQQFNGFYDTTEYSISPSLEDGIIFNNFNDRDNYKAVNIWIIDKISGNFVKNVFNETNINFKDEWKNDENIIIQKNEYVRIVQKRKYHALKWTKKEFDMLYNAFANSGLIMSYPW